MLNRRGFLSLLGTAGAALGLMQLPTELVYDPGKARAVIEGWRAFNLDAMTLRVAKRVNQAGLSLGPILQRDHFTHAFDCAYNVECNFRAGEVVHLSHLDAIGDSLADRLRDAKVGRLVVPLLPNSVEAACIYRDPRTGVVVRGLSQYRIQTDQQITRFDVLGAA